MAAHETNGRQLMEQAQAAENRFSWFSSTSKYEEAGELYSRAANAFKMAKSMDEAGDAYMKSAEAYRQAKSAHECTRNLVEASKAYKKSNPKAAVHALEQAIKYYTDQGRFSSAAKHQQEIAEIHEASGEAIDLAIDSYIIAADMFEGENAVSSANKCLAQAAHLYTEKEDYAKAVKYLEKVAANSLSNSLLQWGCKDYFFKAGLCNLAIGDYESAKSKLEQYCSDDNRFPASRECKFLLALTNACVKNDVQTFTNSIVEYDAISPLDPWKTSILLKVKNHLKESSDGIL